MPDAPKLPPIRPKHTPPPRGTTTQRGYGWAHQKLRKRLIAARPVCERCGKNWSAHMHHIDGDPFNRYEKNLEMLCVACHQAEHAGD